LPAWQSAAGLGGARTASPPSRRDGDDAPISVEGCLGDSGLSFHSLLSLGGGTGNAPMISLRPSLIMEHHFVSTLNDLAPKPRTTLRATRPRDGKRTATRARLGVLVRVRAFCLQRRTGFEETPIRPMIADHGHLSEGCFGRSDRSAQGTRKTRPLRGLSHERPAIRSAASSSSPSTAVGRRFQGAKG
jgi:hypothetical protein